jgi:hypothetical protein
MYTLSVDNQISSGNYRLIYIAIVIESKSNAKYMVRTVECLDDTTLPPAHSTLSLLPSPLFILIVRMRGCILICI